MSYEQSFCQAIDGSRIRISDSPFCGGAEYKPLENSIFLFVLLSDFDGEKVTIKYKGKGKISVIPVPIDELFSETIGHEFLHMLLFWFIDWMTSGCLNSIDNELRADFYDRFLGLCESTGRKT